MKNVAYNIVTITFHSILYVLPELRCLTAFTALFVTAERLEKSNTDSCTCEYW